MKIEQKTAADDVINTVANKLSELDLSDDFSDLLTPPSIPVSDLPVVSKSDEEVGEDG